MRWLAEARNQYAALLPACMRAAGARDTDTLIDRANLAFWTGEAGDPAGARDEYAMLAPVREQVSGAEHPETLTARCADLDGQHQRVTARSSGRYVQALRIGPYQSRVTSEFLANGVTIAHDAARISWRPPAATSSGSQRCAESAT